MLTWAGYGASRETCVTLCPILRTRIVALQESFIQVVIQDDLHWETPNSADLDSAIQAVGSIQMSYGSPLCRYSLMTDSKGDSYFLLNIHHAAHDGWTIRLILSTFSHIYRGFVSPDIPQFGSFIKYILDMDTTAAKKYWNEQLHGASRASFPAKPRDRPQDSAPSERPHG